MPRTKSPRQVVSLLLLFFCVLNNIMSKKPEISPEILENILVKVTERLTETFKLFIDQLVSAVTSRVDHVQSKMDDLNTHLVTVSSRIDDLERKLMLPTTATSSIETGSMDQTLKTLMAVETEKAERAKRSCNVIITGLQPQQGVHDADVFTEFCEHHLTVKPHPVRSSCQRLGRPTNGRPARLKLTLDSSQTVDHLIESSSILRQSTDGRVRNVYINRDQTKLEAQIAYEQRHQRRSSAGTVRSP